MGGVPLRHRPQLPGEVPGPTVLPGDVRRPACLGVGRRGLLLVAGDLVHPLRGRRGPRGATKRVVNFGLCLPFLKLRTTRVAKTRSKSSQRQPNVAKNGPTQSKQQKKNDEKWSKVGGGERYGLKRPPKYAPKYAGVCAKCAVYPKSGHVSTCSGDLMFWAASGPFQPMTGHNQLFPDHFIYDHFPVLTTFWPFSGKITVGGCFVGGSLEPSRNFLHGVRGHSRRLERVLECPRTYIGP